VKITVGAETADWYAFGHELVFAEPPGVTSVIEPLPPMRALLAWRAGPAGALQMIHLLAMGETGPIGRLAPIDLSSAPPPTFPAAAGPAPTCVAARFTFGFSGVEAQPFALRLGSTQANGGTRTLAMVEQSVRGVQVTVPVAPAPFTNVAGLVAP
jgi:hypothetical protein